MKEHLEGEWKNFTFKVVQDGHYYKEIVAHLRNNFYQDETFNKALGDSPLKEDDFDALALYYMEKYQMSFVAVDNETQKVAGVTILSKREKNVDLSALVEKFKSTEFREKLIPFLGLLQSKAKIFETYKDIDHYSHFSMISVDKDFRGRGLASEMVDRSIAMLRAKGFPLLDGTFTSPHTRKIAESKGFKELASKLLYDFKNEKGEIVFCKASEEDSASLMALEL